MVEPVGAPSPVRVIDSPVPVPNPLQVPSLPWVCAVAATVSIVTAVGPLLVTAISTGTAIRALWLVTVVVTSASVPGATLFGASVVTFRSGTMIGDAATGGCSPVPWLLPAFRPPLGSRVRVLLWEETVPAMNREVAVQAVSVSNRNCAAGAYTVPVRLFLEPRHANVLVLDRL